MINELAAGYVLLILTSIEDFNCAIFSYKDIIVSVTMQFNYVGQMHAYRLHTSAATN